MNLQGKKVLVFGSGKSGIGAAELLGQVGAEPVIYDGNADLDKEAVVHKVKHCKDIRVYAGELPQEVRKALDLVVLSPGVPTDIPIVKSFYEQGLPVWGEVELAYRTGKGRVLAITGTNGKTTTTALLGKIMGDAEESVFVVGNIGTPYTSKALEMQDNTTTVAEISSFQLETIEEFAPKVSAILNITEDHLNRHHTMEEYIRVKELIVKNQTADDFCILNYEDPVLREFGRNITPKVVYFSSVRRLEEGIYLDGDQIILKTSEEEIPLVRTGELKLLGQHNFENVMAASAMAYYAGVPVESIRKSICEFTAVEHRIEYVTEKNGVVYYNDSKGTNPDAAIKGIQAMNRPINITEDHLNRHHTMEEYIRVKELIVKNQTADDFCILNYEDPVLREFGRNITPKVVYFSSVRRLEEGIYLDGDQIILKTSEEEIPLVRTGELKLLGQHNFENVMAASAMAYYAGVPVESIRKSICEFTAVEHRIEYVTEKNGVVYYNDSKGTNPDAAIKGIQAMNRPTLLIGGGYDKGSGYDEWLNAFDGKVRYLVLIGQTRDKIKAAAERLGVCPCILCENLEEAVKVCAEKANPGDAVLLSPACASWGQFDNYEQRGDMFKEYVRNL